MPSLARLGDFLLCRDIIIGGSPNTFADGRPVARLADPTSGHDGYYPNFMVTGSASTFVNGRPACRIGDAHAGHTRPESPFHKTVVATGSATTFAG